MDYIEKLKAHSPWITQLIIDGEKYGGDYDAYNDRRLIHFVEKFSHKAKTSTDFSILECGCLEGGHTVKLAKEFPGAKITAIDARISNLEKAKLQQKFSM